jgi:hypothetical protein
VIPPGLLIVTLRHISETLEADLSFLEATREDFPPECGPGLIYAAGEFRELIKCLSTEAARMKEQELKNRPSGVAPLRLVKKEGG